MCVSVSVYVGGGVCGCVSFKENEWMNEVIEREHGQEMQVLEKNILNQILEKQYSVSRKAGAGWNLNGHCTWFVMAKVKGYLHMIFLRCS